MSITQLISQLEYLKAKHGDLQIIGGAMCEDRTIQRVSVLDRNGVALRDKGNKRQIAGVFLEG